VLLNEGITYPFGCRNMFGIWIKPGIMAARNLDIKVYPSANHIW